ncbi:MAG: transporter, partial [Bacteroidales bacterium]|nr:transporter [Bacteroidales bacterium]
LNSAVFGYARSFKLFDRLTKFDIIAPYSFGTFSGTVIDIDSSTSRNGFGDPLLRLSMILIGVKPMGVSEFLKHEQKKFKLGVSVRLRLPLGQYDPTKLLNLGANSWAVKLGVAGSYTIRKKLIFEGHLYSWFFSENKEFYNGNTIE